MNMLNKLEQEIKKEVLNGHLSNIDAENYINFLHDLNEKNNVLNLIRRKSVNVSLIINNDTYSNYLYDLEKTYDHINDKYLTKETLIKNNALTREEFQKLKEVL